MDRSDARALIARLKGDVAFRDEVMAAEGGDARWRIISEAGFDCTPEEFAAERGRMSDEQLGEVTGGRCETLGAGEACGQPSGFGYLPIL
jgi:predicted ribosomally synthesized peptide with nif11-like leader